ncbi:MAG: hypothetical protein AAGC97_03610 [Planctomycetota bacterium]
MQTFTVTAQTPINTSRGRIEEGDSIATIESEMGICELASLLRQSDRISVTSDHDADPDSHDDATPLGDLIDDKPAQLLAAHEPALATVGELRAWIEAGNQPSSIRGITKAVEKKLLAFL